MLGGIERLEIEKTEDEVYSKDMSGDYRYFVLDSDRC
jgi:hypothetical protein